MACAGWAIDLLSVLLLLRKPDVCGCYAQEWPQRVLIVGRKKLLPLR